MTNRRLSLPAAGALACAAFALWLSFGALSFDDADFHAARVGLLPPLTWLGGLLLIALLVAIVIKPAARHVAVLWLSVLILLPWLPLRLPLSAFVWIGPLCGWVWIAMAATLVAQLLRHATPASIARLTTTPRFAAPLAGALAAIAFGIGAWAVSPRLPAGDEPHYLVITQSLLQDHDLKIENNHRRGDYHAYYRSELKPDYLLRGVNGEIYSIHAPGLPLLISPVFAAFGHLGVMIALIAVSAWATGLAWLVAWRVTHDVPGSWFGWAAVTLSAPFFFHAFAVYPDAPAAVLILIGVLPLVDERARGSRRLVITGAALAMLPWLHTRLAVVAAALTIALVGRFVTAPDAAKRLAAFLVFPILSAAAWFSFFWTIYGTPNPAAPYGGATQSQLAYLARGVPGLLFDQQFGLFVNAPAYLCAVAGLFVMAASHRRRLAGELLLVCVPYFLVVTAVAMWWAGYSAPARFLVPFTLLFAIPAAAWYASPRGAAARLFGIGMLLLSVVITASITVADGGATLFNVRDGSSRLLLWLSPVVDITTALPSFFQNPPSVAMLHAAIWLLALAGTIAVGLLVERRGVSAAALVVLLGTTLAVGATAAMSLVWRSNHATVVTPLTGGSALLRRYDPDRNQIGFSFPPLRRVALVDLPARIKLASVIPASRRPGEPLLFLTRPVAATYEIEGFARLPASGHLRIGIERQLPPLDDWDVAALGASWRQTISLPVPAEALRIDADGSARGSLLRLSIRAVAVPGSHERFGADTRVGHATRYGPARVFLVDGHAYMEPGGTWVAGRDHAAFVIAPDSGTPIRLFVRNAAIDNRVTLESGSWRQELVLKAREERLVDIPIDASRPGTAVRVTAQTGARPADTEPNSDDTRLLGCWIETR